MGQVTVEHLKYLDMVTKRRLINKRPRENDFNRDVQRERIQRFEQPMKCHVLGLTKIIVFQGVKVECLSSMNPDTSKSEHGFLRSAADI